MAKKKEQKDIRSRTLNQGISYQQMAKQLMMCIQIDRPMFMWGPPGVGKSALCQQIAKELGYDYIDIRMSLLNPVDLRGIPYADMENQVANWLRPVFLPDHPKCLINFDELNVAAPTVQAASYQWILDRKCGEFELPKDCPIVACGNRAQDEAVIHKMPAPLRNRMFHLEMRADLEDWKAWAYDNGIDSKVIGFLNWKESELFRFDPATHTKGFPSPRSWEYVSDVCKKAGDNLDDYSFMVEGAVGQGTGIDFMSYNRVASQLPDIEGIVLRGDMPEAPSDPGALFALASGIVYTGLSRLLDKPKDKQIEGMKNILKYICKRMGGDFAVVCSKDLARTPLWTENRPSLAETPEVTEWVNHCGKVAL